MSLCQNVCACMCVCLYCVCVHVWSCCVCLHSVYIFVCDCVYVSLCSVNWSRGWEAYLLLCDKKIRTKRKTETEMWKTGENNRKKENWWIMRSDNGKKWWMGRRQEGGTEESKEDKWHRLFLITRSKVTLTPLGNKDINRKFLWPSWQIDSQFSNFSLEMCPLTTWAPKGGWGAGGKQEAVCFNPLILISHFW